MNDYLKIIAFRCANPGCRRAPFVTEKAAKAHALKCIHSIDSHACPTCEHDCEDGCGVGARSGGVALIRQCSQWELKA